MKIKSTETINSNIKEERIMANTFSLAEFSKLLDDEIQSRDGRPECMITYYVSGKEKMVIETFIDEVEYTEKENHFFLFCTTGNFRSQNYSIHESEVDKCIVETGLVDLTEIDPSVGDWPYANRFTIIDKKGNKFILNV